MNNIYLIGMPGCGKSTIGKILSRDLGLEHIDADDYLEKKYNDTIPNIFNTKGEDDFRKKESAVMEELSKKNGIIVSTGGGVVVRNINKNIMRQSGTVVFIDTTAENILSNSSLSGRPLLKDKNRIFELYENRISLYRDFAHITVDNNGKIEDAVSKIKQHFNKE